jgi:hypothetical protein
MIYALRERHLERLQREELLLGQINSSIINFSFGAPKDPVAPDRFMLHPFKKSVPEPEKPLTGEDLMAAFAGFPKSKESMPCRL